MPDFQTQGAAPSKPPLSPSFHFPSISYVNVAQAIIYRGAGFDIARRSFATVPPSASHSSLSPSSLSGERWR
jgi:hypothetical protein